MTQTLETKAQFAARKKRSPSAISNWIAEGKISQAALIGKGIRARIWVERAEADLAGNLDDGQQLAQDVPANAGLSSQPPAASAASAPPEPLDKDLQRRREADAKRAEHEAELSELRVNKEAGRWIDAAKAQQAWGKELSEILTDTETFIVQRLTRAIADEHGLEWKNLATFARQKWHEYRSAAAERARARLSELESVDVE